ncbi:MAG TPA: metallopeptidase family protein [Polyangiaceae bacterium]|nr:metallopeptidase family protein [Polyangiaceae bacterium]
MTASGGSAPVDAVNATDTSPDLPDELWETLEDLYDLAEEDPPEALSTFQSFPEGLRELREFQMALAYIEKRQEDYAAAEKRLRSLLVRAPDDADVHHQLGDLLDDAGRPEDATRHFLRTLELDSASPALATPELLDRIGQALEGAVRDLPAEYQERLAHVPLLVESRPSVDLVESGFDPRAMGLFDGLDHEGDLNQAHTTAPTRIVLYAENLIDEAGDGPELEEEVIVTVLHEIGHYFGLDEDDMERLGLD